MTRSPALNATGLVKRFDEEGGIAVEAVAGVSLVVHPGELVMVMGPSGSGKTTLLSLLGGLSRPTAGEVRLHGEALGELDQEALAAHRLRAIGFVFQASRLIEALTAVENIELPLNLAGQRRPGSRTRALALLEQVGLSARAGFRPRALSGGERQRVAIARALANDPFVVLADEPTGNLDSQNGQMVIALLHQAAHQDGKAVVVVSHDERLRHFADRVLRMEDGGVKPG